MASALRSGAMETDLMLSKLIPWLWGIEEGTDLVSMLHPGP